MMTHSPDKQADFELRWRQAIARDIEELSFDWYWRQDAQLRYVEFSGNIEGSRDRDRESWMGKRRWELPIEGVTPSQWEQHKALLGRRQPFFNFEYRIGTTSGRRWFMVSGKPLYDGNGGFLGYHGVGLDVTARKHALEQLRESEARFRGLLELSSDWYWEQDAELRFSWFSADTRRHSGYSMEKAIGRRRWDLPDLVPLSGTWEEHKAVLEARKPFRNFEMKRRGEDGFMRYLSLSGAPVFAEDGSFRGYRGVGHDITARTISRRRLKESEERFRALTDMSSDWYWEQDEDLRFVRFSGVDRRAIAGIGDSYGRRRWELPSIGVTEEQWAEHRRALEARQPFDDFEYRRVMTIGEARWFSITGRPLFDEQGRFRGYHGIGRDITERREAEERLRESEERFRALIELSSDWYWEQDENFRFSRVSPGLEAVSLPFEPGRTRWELTGQDPECEQWSQHRALLEARQPFRDFTYETRDGDGATRWVSISGEPVFDRQGVFRGYHGVGTDITARVNAEREIKRLAEFDFLTELPNRTLFNDRMQQAIAAAGRQERRFALLFVDLDRFRDVNNSHGHEAGDELLRQLGRRFASCVRSGDTVCRQGGDEFLVLLPMVGDATGAARLAKRLLDAAAGPFEVGGLRVDLSASIGIALYPEDGKDAATLIKNADAAMYHTKASGRNGFRFFTPDMHEQVSSRLHLERRLREAIDGERLSLLYQPQIDLRTGALAGVEALPRWVDAELGEVPRARFLPLAEETRLIVALGQWMLREACRQARALQTRLGRSLRMAVNVSAVQFQRDDVATFVASILHETQLPPSLLELEIAEDVLAGDAALQQLSAVSAMGVRIALADFGAGLTSLQQLKHFKVDRLKIHPGFVRAIDDSTIDATIAAAIVSLGHTLGLRVLAAGAETAAQRSLLARIGCHEAQADALLPPLEHAALESLVASEQPLNHPA
jgi:diguanylate cyclase (GGDEF)-like protein/PAS domain S-box-containing protein